MGVVEYFDVAMCADKVVRLDRARRTVVDHDDA
ncbi:Uncharacterised protein [Mycobacterium tuberculosis]|uniref:Uncharacterized protein n=1 Tax=Mycobacterium tuberculosis TaxID=1773 RepID=A0A916P8S7_MYCTX|nr:Uncharacterised protein [Mycobacterium tuberculosis]COZ22059.1 Uncharacterised protein [Mycobacterium tuberculosis]CPA60590.1 Uncharacterised protein [Mycobacterium tuberculosis]